MGLLRKSKSVTKRVDPTTMKLLELVMTLLLSWHYIGCFWWYIGTQYDRSVAERVHVLGVVPVVNSTVTAATIEPATVTLPLRDRYATVM